MPTQAARIPADAPLPAAVARAKHPSPPDPVSPFFANMDRLCAQVLAYHRAAPCSLAAAESDAADTSGGVSPAMMNASLAVLAAAAEGDVAAGLRYFEAAGNDPVFSSSAVMISWLGGEEGCSLPAEGGV